MPISNSGNQQPRVPVPRLTILSVTYTVAIRFVGGRIVEFQKESMGTAGGLSSLRGGSAHARLAFPPLVPEACPGAEARTEEAARRGENNRRRT
jgi:hypothetical protein